MKTATANIAVEAPARSAGRLGDFLELTKPRLNFLVLATTAVGYYMAVQADVEWVRLLHTLGGTALTAGAAAVLNQWMERRLDGLMKRTAGRPLPTGRVAPREAMVWGTALGAAGVIWLAVGVNWLTAGLGALTLLSYLLAYTPMKRWSTLNTVVGAVPGAIPPVMGFTAVRGHLGPEAAWLFAVLFLWQMPHFLAIAALYREDYGRAGFRMLPVMDADLTVTGRQIVTYCAALLPVSLLAVPLGMAHWLYAAGALVLGLVFLGLGVRAAMERGRLEFRRLFFGSILYLPLLLGLLMLGKP
jgi:protoheme IX farnesyltransferase